MDGWIKLHRKILDNPIVFKDPDHVTVWIYLLLNATHKEHAAIFAGEKIILKSGQLITGRRAIADKTGVEESKVYRILARFKKEQQIEQQSSNKNSLITILNWGYYQNSEQQIEQPMNSQYTTTEQQVNTNKNDNKEKSFKENTLKSVKEKRFAPPTPENVSEYCREMGYTHVDADRFVDFYSAKGWMVGKNHMKDWKAAARNWERSQRQESTAKGTEKKSPTRFSNFEQRHYDYDAMVWDGIKGDRK